MDSIRNIVARSDGDDSRSTIDLMIAILSLVFFGLLLIGLLALLRKKRRQQAAMQRELLPRYHELRGNPHRLTIHTKGMDKLGRSSVIVFGCDGQPMLANPRSPPHSPDNVPEIHITFPDEQDDQGRHQSGRVLVVRVGDNAAVGLEPLHEENLPAYEKESKTQFYSIDMDHIGGLKEKERNPLN